MLTEDQIQRYSRHLLLPGVGSRGQEALLATEVKLQGEEPWASLCGDYLAAAGCTVDAHSGPGLRLSAGGWVVVASAAPGVASPSAPSPVHPERREELATTRVEGLTVLATTCAACATPSGPLGLTLGPVAATLAATELLRRLLGLASDASAWTVTAQGLKPRAIAPCPHGGTP